MQTNKTSFKKILRLKLNPKFHLCFKNKSEVDILIHQKYFIILTYLYENGKPYGRMQNI